MSRLKSFRHAFAGLFTLLRTQHNAWLHAFATALVIIVAAVLQVRGEDWRWLIIAILLVWVSETLNTAIEYICDVVSPQHNEAVKHAKDISAGAVLLCAVGAVLIGLITLWPYMVAMYESLRGPIAI